MCVNVGIFSYSMQQCQECGHGELPISPNMGGAVVFIIVGTLGLECLCMCRWNVHWYREETS